MDDEISQWASRDFWRILFTCSDCEVDVTRLVRGNPDEVVRCLSCEWSHVRRVSDRLLDLALSDTAS